MYIKITPFHPFKLGELTGVVGWWFRKAVTGAGQSKQLLGDRKLLFLSQTDYRTESQARQYKVVCLATLAWSVGALRSH